MNVDRIFNLQASLHRHYPELQAAYTLVIAQAAEREIDACAVHFAQSGERIDPYVEILEAVDHLMGDRLIRVQCALMAILLIETDTRYQEAHS